jgi:protein arginine N-methyltransferase 5
MNGIPPRWATLATVLTTEDVADAIGAPDSNSETPVLRLAAEARAKGYDTLSLPITTEKWRKRWAEMCLVGVDATDTEEQAATRAAEAWRLRPGFLKDEVTISRLGEPVLQILQCLVLTQSLQRTADEAEGVIVMVSEWLELDSPDDGIRHDAEIVRWFPF